ncbi:MAG: hypothetical protein HN729_10545 [Candidatus Marinimicrobia bacterium]|jgi:hypothetical protein|nr:hypothetical protein [Candidatus Neomarinimicrobiota bacterium]MBT3634089.1 hypothetical protein [Candidatus Neomarinimicrobiota bacterium]MBT3683037.1 hypothetical protein [Candidatus Neomarinimicrobiota bacterium]MBT3759871.1 hypothetical protein [Candidatus Neomarinimicrobiota bacterium]MBT3895676.1 hypothetical protein [Candidatus Neomarinimicrobiota bacterium]
MRIIFILLLLTLGLTQESQLIERWHTYEEIQTQLEAWDEEFGDNIVPTPGYPGSGIIYHLEEIGRSNQADIPFWGVRLSYNANVKEDEPRILFLGQCHAEEILGVEITMQLIHKFLNPIESVGTPFYSNMLSLLQQAEIWVVPTYNPEGLQMVHGFEDEFGNWLQDESYRKNRTDVNLNGIFDFELGIGNDSDGVDLNRNYDFNWFLGDGPWEIDGGCSSNPNYFANFDYYRGASPWSESESRAIREFAIDQNFLLSIAYHSSRSGCVSEKVISSWNWEGEKHSPDFEVVAPLGLNIANLTPNEEYSGFYLFVPGVSRRGNAHDWFYTETGTIQYLIETGSSNLQPDDEELIDDTVERNLNGAFHLMNRAVGYNGLDPEISAEHYQVEGIITDESSGLPMIAEVIIEEMNGPMLKPRMTDEIGRYRRLLYPGTFTIVFQALGYETQTHQITSSSSAINELDVSLIPKSLNEVTFDISVPEFYNGDIQIIITDELSADTLLVNSNMPSIILPSNGYNFIILGSDDLYPIQFTDYIDSDVILPVELKWSGIIFTDDFDDLSNWEVAEGFWNTQMGYLKSQESLIYGVGRKTLTSTASDINLETGSLALILDWKYELEWDNDTGFVKLETESDSRTTSWFDQGWGLHREYNRFDNFEGSSLQLTVGLYPDSTLGYRGIEIDKLQVWYEPLGDCPLGDVNRDGNMDVLDIVVIVSGILDINLTSYQRCSGDHTLDGSVDILDIVSIITIILET